MTTENLGNGWLLTKEISDKTTKWVLENKGLNYRDYIYIFEDRDNSGRKKLINNVEIRMKLKRSYS